MKVSSSRQPPPNVTTTARRFRVPGAARAGFEEKLNDARLAVAPVTSRRNSLRLRETDSMASRGFKRSDILARFPFSQFRAKGNPPQRNATRHALWVAVDGTGDGHNQS